MNPSNQTQQVDYLDFHWLDVTNPTPQFLSELSTKYELHLSTVQDCLMADHLPKFEEYGDVGFLILRGYDENSSEDADTVQELTRKVAVFHSERFLITVHRKELPYMSVLLAKYSERALLNSVVTPEKILADIIGGVIHTYDKPVTACLTHLEHFEAEIFGASGTQEKFRLQKGYYLKRKASVFKRILHATIEPLNSLMANTEAGLLPALKNMREHIDNIYFYADEITDSMDSLLNLHVSLSSQKTNEASHRINEIMRVLTIFSVFFLPINFIAGVYGMNFEFMPETKSHYGYPLVLGVMVLVVLTIFTWFRRKGWLR